MTRKVECICGALIVKYPPVGGKQTVPTSGSVRTVALIAADQLATEEEP